MHTLGIDSSTQSMKALVWDAGAKRVVKTVSVNFGRDLPEFNSPDGFLPNADPLVRRANPLMWLKALDMVLEKLQKEFDTSKIDAVGGDGQQHGSVCLGAGWTPALGMLNGESRTVNGGSGLAGTFKYAFSRKESPIWMDSSTSKEVAELDAKFGDSMRRRTGSPAIERFTGPQLMKFAKDDPVGWADTSRVHLVSSFLCSILAGQDAPVDTGDGAGMNLLNLETLDWDSEICAFTAPGLPGKLPSVARPGGRTSLKLAPYFAKYGLRPGIPVAPFTGDNPASLVGTGADAPGVAVISLGTSDTFFAAMKEFRTDPGGCGHVFGNPSGGFMSLACFKNGSLAREKVRAMVGCDYAFFDEGAFDEAKAFKGRAFPYFEEEITPKHAPSGIEADFAWTDAGAAEKVVSVIRGQVLNMYERTRWIGSFDTIRVTGGASRSRGIRETVADVFGAKVETLDIPDSAALGGAKLAASCCAV
ncbi:MAG: carbohydrate kinase [Kiritimatiellae bacterium]|nr:carbohydrate kinase [Kiritimatiellia bacterium]